MSTKLPVMSTRVHQVDLFVRDDRVRGWAGLVVDDGRVCPHGADGGEAETLEVVLSSVDRICLAVNVW